MSGTRTPRERLQESLEALDDSAPGLMAHLVAGYPDRATTIEAAAAIERGGAHVLELQFPFSDPLADGPTVLGACQHALDHGVDHGACLEMLAEITSRISIPTVVMTYANVPFARGFDAFANELARAGATGLILPDLPDTEPEFEELLAALKRAGVSWIPVIAPTSTDETVRRLGSRADTFVYTVVRLGVTGRASSIDEAVRGRLERVSELSEGRPVAAGFGIRERAQVQLLQGAARLAVVGSRIVQALEDAPGADAAAERVETLCRSLLDSPA